MMNDDMTLVREFAASRSESAFATLVERHIGLVHSAALRQTGDAALAEEITQSVFLILAQKAASLGAKTILSAWLYRATRFAAADALKAQRRRQAREQEAYMQSTLNQPDDHWQKLEPLLDDAMDELGETDRAALVLRFFENKTAREIAGALRLEEGAAQKRVTRALEKLRGILVKQGVALSATAIAGALASNAVQAAPVGLAGTVSAAGKGAVSAAGIGIVSKGVSMLGKSWLFAWFPLLLSLLGSLPSLLFVSLVGRSERKNFQDQNGFRPLLHRRYVRSFLWGFPLLLLGFALVHRTIVGAWGIDTHRIVIACFLLAVMLISARSLTICRNLFHVGSFIYAAILVFGVGASVIGWLPKGLVQLPLLLGTMVFFFIFHKRPMRLDYSLFLRAAQNMLKSTGTAGGMKEAFPLSRRKLLAFARFLGSRDLVNGFKWAQEGLNLRLQPAGNRFPASMISIFIPPGNRRGSFLSLSWDGTISAHCSASDFAFLSNLNPHRTLNLQELERTVSEYATHSWQAFRVGKITAAEQAVGELPESEIFVVSPSRARSTLYWRLYIGATVIVLAVLIYLNNAKPESMSGLKPVNVTEAEVREFLNDTGPNPNPKYCKPNSAGTALFSCLALPSTNLYTPEGLMAMRDEVAEVDGFAAWKKTASKNLDVFSPLSRHALAHGWVSWKDLDINLPDFTARYRASPYAREPLMHWDLFLTRMESWSWVKEERFKVLRMGADGLAQLRLSRAWNCLDLFDNEKLIREILSVQTLSGTPQGQPPIHDWKDIRGLFFTPGHPAIEDTYYALAALEILGALDRIDREACIQGILRRHRGKGYFTSPNSGGFNEYQINGAARDTIAAYESLRILGALDRVKDLDQWQFRLKKGRILKDHLTWTDVEAWVCRERFQKIMADRKQNPQKPFGSLLEPNGV